MWSAMAASCVALDGWLLQVPEFRLAGTTAHFDITCAPELDRQADEIGRRAERAYAQLSSSLRHQLSLRPLLVLFGTRGDLEHAVRTRTVPGNREHLLLSLDIPTARIPGHLTHELSHVFLFDMLPTPVHGEIPRWMSEGLAEHHRGEWDASDLAIVREMVRAGSVPAISSAAGSVPQGDDRSIIVVGHAAFDFLAARAGGEGPARFLASLREGRESNPVKAYLAVVGLASGELERALNQYLSARFVSPMNLQPPLNLPYLK
jgi:hypothetical protein